MKILSFDSSATSASVCLFDTNESKVIGEFYINTKLTHSQTLIPMLDSLISSADININDIDCFAVNTGPGSFTGIRIGVSAVKGMAMALDKPCVGVSTLNCIAHNFIDFDDVIICSCMDARRNQVYNALFSVNDGVVTRMCDDRAISIEDLYTELKELDKKVILAGDGAQLCYSQKPEDYNLFIAGSGLRYQKASSVALCAVEDVDNSRTISAQALMPSYLRPSQAERERINKERNS